MNYRFYYTVTKGDNCDKVWVWCYTGRLDKTAICNATVEYDSCPDCHNFACINSKERERLTIRTNYWGLLSLSKEEELK
jgi:hypothetical protein